MQCLHWCISSFVLDANHGPKILSDPALDKHTDLRPSGSTDVDKQPGFELSFSAFLLHIFSKLKPGFLSMQHKEEIHVWAHGFALQLQNMCVWDGVLPEETLPGKGGNPVANRVRLASHPWCSAQNDTVVKNSLNAAFLKVVLWLEEVTPLSLCGQRGFLHILCVKTKTPFSWVETSSVPVLKMTCWPISKSILRLYLSKLQRNESLETGRELSEKQNKPLKKTQIQMKQGKLELDCNMAYISGVWTFNSKVAAWQVLQTAEKDKKIQIYPFLFDHSITWDSSLKQQIQCTIYRGSARI